MMDEWTFRLLLLQWQNENFFGMFASSTGYLDELTPNICAPELDGTMHTKRSFSFADSLKNSVKICDTF